MKRITIYDVAKEADVSLATVSRVINDSTQAIVLADHTKFGVRNALNFAAVDELDVVVTDNGTPDRYIDCLRDTGLKVVVAKVKQKK